MMHCIWKATRRTAEASNWNAGRVKAKCSESEGAYGDVFEKKLYLYKYTHTFARENVYVFIKKSKLLTSQKLEMMQNASALISLL